MPTGSGTPRGMQHPMAKLTEKSVREIRAKRFLGVSVGVLARRYKVSVKCISDVANRKRWRHVL